jgi:hypothetical protein
MTILPSGYDPNPLHPRIIITNLSGGAAYTFESEQLLATPTQDFKLQALKLHLGTDDDFGYLQLVIHDHDNVLTDLTKNRRPGLIGREWAVQLYLGKTLATEERWFYGKIKDFTVSRPTTGIQTVSLTCVGWGVILRERMSRLTRNQAKTSDGVSLDDTDNSTKISELILDLFQETDHQIDENIQQIPNIIAEISTTGNGIEENATSGKIANINYTVASYAQIISNLCGIANTTWHINADRRLIVQDPESVDSGFLFTNDFTASSDLNTWDATKMAYILNAPLEWKDSSADMLYNFVHGFGHFNPALSSSDGGTPDASDNLDTAWHAIPITPTTDNIAKIAIRSIRTGLPTSNASVEIWGDTGGSGPNESDIRRKIILNKKTLEKLGTTTPANWVEIPIKPKLSVTPGEQLYIVFPKFGDASNTINVNYEAGSGTFWDSSDGTTWTSRTGKSAFRVYDARRLVTTVENIDATELLPEPRERIFPIRSDLEEQTVRETLLQAAAVLGKQKRTYGTVTVSAPTSRIPLSTFCVLQDVKTGLDVKATIVGLDLQATPESQGVQTVELSLESYQR